MFPPEPRMTSNTLFDTTRFLLRRDCNSGPLLSHHQRFRVEPSPLSRDRGSEVWLLDDLDRLVKQAGSQ